MEVIDKEMLEWWEGKRLIYTLILTAFSAFILIWDFNYFQKYQPDITYSLGGNILFAVFWIFGANIFYCLGAGFEATWNHYGYHSSKPMRLTLFIFGTLASVVWTAISLPTT